MPRKTFPKILRKGVCLTGKQRYSQQGGLACSTLPLAAGAQLTPAPCRLFLEQLVVRKYILWRREQRDLKKKWQISSHGLQAKVMLILF